MLFGPFRLALRIASFIVLALLVYFAVTLVQVWLTSREYNPHPAAAIIVMGAAQYNGNPSPDLRARLNEALSLFHSGYANLIVLTGSKEKGDTYTEAQSGATYLESLKGSPVPKDDILQAGGSNSYENVADAVQLLRPRHVTSVLMTTDPFHEDRSMAIASSLGLDPSAAPTQTSPIKGWATAPYFLKEAVGVGLGRVIGFNHLDWLHDA
jgi:uncharacterized SAM-binding protein YcdF (DUF218 family)